MFERHIARPLAAALGDTPVVFLRGPRQTGKSTLAKQMGAGAWQGRYLTLDDAAVLSAAQDDPGGFLAGLTSPVVLDEVQRVPELFLAIKADVDRKRQPGRFLLTGSADVLLLPRLSDSLAGRMEILTLWPLSQAEIAGVTENFVDRLFEGPDFESLPTAEGEPDLADRLLAGGYPEALARASESRRRAWFGSYITTILQRDIRDLAQIEGLSSLPRLLSLLASRACSLVNFADLARSLGIPQTTLKRYFTLLETAMLIQVLPPWSTNLGKRLVKSPKLLINDAGLTAYLLGLNRKRLSVDAMPMGPLLENFVAMELRKLAAWSQTQPGIYHFRLQTGQEVDLVLEDPAGRVVGIEVKASTTVTARDFVGLKTLATAIAKRFTHGYVVYRGSEVVPFGANLSALPVTSLWTQ